MEDGEVCLVASAIFGLVQKSEKEKSYHEKSDDGCAALLGCARDGVHHVYRVLMYTA